MKIALSEEASNAILDALADMLNGGSIELLSDNRVLAILRLSDPATLRAENARLEFLDIASEDAAIAQGTVTMARIMGGNGSEIFSCDVGTEDSDAVIKFKGTTKVYRGQPVQLDSFQLAMP